MVKLPVRATLILNRICSDNLLHRGNPAYYILPGKLWSLCGFGAWAHSSASGRFLLLASVVTPPLRSLLMDLFLCMLH